MHRLRVVTVNTAKCDPPYRRRLELLAEGLAALDPDVVALQECFLTVDRTADTAGYLADALGMRAAGAPARWKERPHEGRAVMSASGLALLTRQPLAAATTVALPTDQADGERIGQVGVLCFGDRAVAIVNLHLTHLRGADDLPRAQLAALLAHPWLARPSAARLLCGDFNADLTALPGLLPADGRWDVADVFELGAGRAPRETVHDRCVDFVLSAAGCTATHPRFLGAWVTLDRPDAVSGIYPSDHRAVATTLVLD
jgi:endonuclease/exonuclease/phosphatase family metal-dependent hydrolase